jgi:hypothetical protein
VVLLFAARRRAPSAIEGAGDAGDAGDVSAVITIFVIGIFSS